VVRAAVCCSVAVSTFSVQWAVGYFPMSHWVRLCVTCVHKAHDTTNKHNPSGPPLKPSNAIGSTPHDDDAATGSPDVQ
jgi:hypothetical protein